MPAASRVANAPIRPRPIQLIARVVEMSPGTLTDVVTEGPEVGPGIAQVDFGPTNGVSHSITDPIGHIAERRSVAIRGGGDDGRVRSERTPAHAASGT